MANDRPEPLTDARLAEILALAETIDKATPGPWKTWRSLFDTCDVRNARDAVIAQCGEWIGSNPTNADAIVAARNYAPAAIRELAAEVASLHSECGDAFVEIARLKARVAELEDENRSLENRLEEWRS